MNSEGESEHADAASPPVTNTNNVRVKKAVTFDGLTVYYFPRTQGFNCVPSQGGSTLGMGSHHVSVEHYSLNDYAELKDASHRHILLEHEKQGLIVLPDNFNETSQDWMCDGYYFLQPIAARQRRLLLHQAGVTYIDPSERDECRTLRASRSRCGCTCRNVCDISSCSCYRAGIRCQVDQLSFPCGCTRDGCSNHFGRIEFNAARVRAHFLQTLVHMQVEQESLKRPAVDEGNDNKKRCKLDENLTPDLLKQTNVNKNDRNGLTCTISSDVTVAGEVAIGDDCEMFTVSNCSEMVNEEYCEIFTDDSVGENNILDISRPVSCHEVSSSTMPSSMESTTSRQQKTNIIPETDLLNFDCHYNSLVPVIEPTFFSDLNKSYSHNNSQGFTISSADRDMLVSQTSGCYHLEHGCSQRAKNKITSAMNETETCYVHLRDHSYCCRKSFTETNFEAQRLEVLHPNSVTRDVEIDSSIAYPHITDENHVTENSATLKITEEMKSNCIVAFPDIETASGGTECNGSNSSIVLPVDSVTEGDHVTADTVVVAGHIENNKIIQFPGDGGYAATVTGDIESNCNTALPASSVTGDFIETVSECIKSISNIALPVTNVTKEHVSVAGDIGFNNNSLFVNAFTGDAKTVTREIENKGSSMLNVSTVRGDIEIVAGGIESNSSTAKSVTRGDIELGVQDCENKSNIALRIDPAIGDTGIFTESECSTILTVNNLSGDDETVMDDIGTATGEVKSHESITLPVSTVTKDIETKTGNEAHVIVTEDTGCSNHAIPVKVITEDNICREFPQNTVTEVVEIVPGDTRSNTSIVLAVDTVTGASDVTGDIEISTRDSEINTSIELPVTTVAEDTADVESNGNIVLTVNTVTATCRLAGDIETVMGDSKISTSIVLPVNAVPGEFDTVTGDTGSNSSIASTFNTGAIQETVMEDVVINSITRDSHFAGGIEVVTEDHVTVTGDICCHGNALPINTVRGNTEDNSFALTQNFVTEDIENNSLEIPQTTVH